MDKLIMQFLGTGAAEGIPSPFCRCRVCENARKVKGKEIRHRSCFRLSNEVLIDFGPDVFSQLVKYNQDLYDLKHLLITHFHADHLDVGNLFLKPMVSRKNGEKLNVYLTEKLYDMLDRGDKLGLYNQEHFITEKFKDDYIFHKVDFFKPFKVGQYLVTAIKGEHYDITPQNSSNLLIELPNNKKILYALDTGYYSNESFAYLKNYKLDILIIESTFGSLDRGPTPFSHLDIRGSFNVCDSLFENGTITKDTKVYFSHINQEQEYTHQEFVDKCNSIKRDYSVTVAYDGLTIYK